MVEHAKKKSSVKLYEWMLEAVDAEKSKRKVGRKEPTYAELMAELWHRAGGFSGQPQIKGVSPPPDPGVAPKPTIVDNLETASANPWIVMLQTILHSGNTRAISAVQENLKLFFDYIGHDPDDLLGPGETDKPRNPPHMPPRSKKAGKS